MLTVYLALAISGRKYSDVVNDIYVLRDALTDLGYAVLHPMTGKSYLRNELEFKAHGYDNPVSTNHAIFERDQFMVRSCDIVLMNLAESDRVSIGCMMELAWASLLGKHTVVLMEKENIHRHSFVLEAADVIFETLDEAMNYLEVFSKQEV